MKKLKLIIATFTILFAILVTKANESHENAYKPMHKESINPICNEDNFEVNNPGCTGVEVATISDIEMREEYNTLNEEKDAPVDFNLNNYLPEGFNAYDEDESNLTAHEILNEEADVPFEFKTSDYLPLNFYVSK